MDVQPNQPIILHNIACVYCGVALAKETSTKEHVIGRRFVPKGKLAGSWNLIINACEKCNGVKSDLENDISAITMQPDAWGKYGHDDEEAALEAERKAEKSFSRLTKESVKDSQENRTIKGSLGQTVTASFSFDAPPQVEEDRVFALAGGQLMAFFYLITFNEEARRGGYWIGGFYPVLCTKRPDWGNPINRAFVDTVAQWEHRFWVCTADGFYRAMIKRHPDATCWSWALEWNKNFRVVGFFGDEQASQEIIAGFPDLEYLPLPDQPDQPGLKRSIRREIPLDENEDRMFEYLTDKE